MKSNAGMAAMLHFLAKRVTHQTKMSLECSSAPPVDPLRPADTCSWPDISIVPLLMVRIPAPPSRLCNIYIVF